MKHLVIIDIKKMNNKQIFDFEKHKEMGHSPALTKWLKENNSRKITEQEFVKEMIEKIRPLSIAKHKWHGYSPSALKRKYKNLKRKFGFFE